MFFRIAIALLLPLVGFGVTFVFAVVHQIAIIGPAIILVMGVGLMSAVAYTVLGPSWARIETGWMLAIVSALCLISGLVAFFMAVITAVTFENAIGMQTSLAPALRLYGETLLLWSAPALPVLAAKLYIERPQWFALDD